MKSAHNINSKFVKLKKNVHKIQMNIIKRILNIIRLI